MWISSFLSFASFDVFNIIHMGSAIDNVITIGIRSQFIFQFIYHTAFWLVKNSMA